MLIIGTNIKKQTIKYEHKEDKHKKKKKKEKKLCLF